MTFWLLTFWLLTVPSAPRLKVLHFTQRQETPLSVLFQVVDMAGTSLCIHRHAVMAATRSARMQPAGKHICGAWSDPRA